MSDITKKIFSIEPDLDEVVRPVSAQNAAVQPIEPDPVPSFVTRTDTDRRAPQPTTILTPEVPPTKWIMWSVIGFAGLWLLGAGLYFSTALSGGGVSLFQITGLALLLMLPIALIALLWISLRRLVMVLSQSRDVAVAAQALITPNESALSHTQSLAEGIRREITSVNTKLADTVETLIEVQRSISREGQTLDSTGAQLTLRSEEVGRNLMLQRQALENIAGTFDERVEALKTQLVDKSRELDDVTTASEMKIAQATTAMQTVSDNLEKSALTASESLSTTTQSATQAMAATTQSASEALVKTSDTAANKLALSAQSASEGFSHVVQTASSEMKAAIQLASNELFTAAGGATETVNVTIGQLGDATRKIDTSSEALGVDLDDAAKQLNAIEVKIAERTRQLETLNTVANEKVSDLQNTITYGNELLHGLTAEAHSRDVQLGHLYKDLEDQLRQAEDITLASQGKTSRMVEANLAQMRREFTRMETDMQIIQAKLLQMRDETEALELLPKEPAARLRLTPLDTDFPPVEPPKKVAPVVKNIVDDPDLLNLGADMQIEDTDQALDESLTSFEPDVIKRPAALSADSSAFGRNKKKDEVKSSWHWRDMLGGLEPADGGYVDPLPTAEMPPEKDTPQPVEKQPAKPDRASDIIGQLTALQLSPSAIVDDGTIIDATQARINKGEKGLAEKVAERLPEPAAHLRGKMDADSVLAADVSQFADAFAKQMGSTPPTAPSLRAAFSSTQGRAYLLCAAALTL